MWRNNNLSIVLVILFAVSLSGHALAGWMAHNAEERLHGGAAIPLATFLTSSEFGETIFGNWQSEFLQMAFYVILTVFLYQKGSAESKKHDGTDKVKEDPAAHRNEPDVPGPVRAGGWLLSVYKSWLSLALVALFPGVVFGPCGRRRTQVRGGTTAARIHSAGHVIELSPDLSILVRVVPELAKRIPGCARDRRAVDSTPSMGLARVEAGARTAFGNRRRLIRTGVHQKARLLS